MESISQIPKISFPKLHLYKFYNFFYIKGQIIIIILYCSFNVLSRKLWNENSNYKKKELLSLIKDKNGQLFCNE